MIERESREGMPTRHAVDVDNQRITTPRSDGLSPRCCACDDDVCPKPNPNVRIAQAHTPEASSTTIR